MSEETATTTEAETTETTTETTEEQRVPYERFQQANKKAKEAADRAKALEKQMADLQAQIDEREQAGLPELERLKKDMERTQKRAEEAEQRAEQAERERERGRKERWITAAASEQNFADPSDAAAFLNLDEIDDEKDAERAVKRLAGQKKHLVKAEGPVLPGRVLENGRTASTSAEGSKTNIDLSREAEMLAEGLKQFASKD